MVTLQKNVASSIINPHLWTKKAVIITRFPSEPFFERIFFASIFFVAII